MDISGQAALVTGGASGLGLATAKRLAEAGAKVTLLDMNEEAGRKEAEALGGHFIKVDVADDGAVRDAVAEAEDKHGVARILINCAGVGTPSKMLDREGKATPLDFFAKVIGINLIGTYNVTAKFAERLAASEPLGEERGVVVNTASVAAYDGQIGQPAYAASKSGVVGMTLPLARELARYGIRVMAIAPGIFRTPMVAGLPQEAQDSLGKQVPFPSRLGDPDEYAKLAEAIIGNPMLNGETIRLDGAIRMAPK